MDFTLNKYSSLIEVFKKAGYRFVTFQNYCVYGNELNDDRFVILRHDVDKKAPNALKIAQMDAASSVRSSFYFRIVKQSNDPEVIKAIAALGHEIGYHYEDLSYCQGDFKWAIQRFKENLSYFRQFYPVNTICMHGAPQSPYDGRDLWKQHDYHDFGIIGEPYFDMDFSKVFYLTDTGRRWDGFNVSLRDKVPTCQDKWVKMGWVYHSTDDILKALAQGTFPEKLMLTTHPQRWTSHWGLWIGEYVSQSLKNVVKKRLVR
jgi:hypothetical protein